MATREFYTNGVVAKCQATMAKLEADMAAKHEENIRGLMAVPCGGFWPFTKPRLRSREACEQHYGEASIAYTSRWWAERSYKGSIRRINSIRSLASAYGADGRIQLSDEEASLVGAAH